MRLSPLAVGEGKEALVTLHHLHITLDYSRFGIRKSGVIFHVTRLPLHGAVVLQASDHHEGSRPTDDARAGGQSSTLGRASRAADTLLSFTLQDVELQSVRYRHDGSETERDSALLQLQLIAQPGYILPAYLQVRHEMVFPFAITPVNDVPVVVLPGGSTIRVARKVPLLLDTSVVKAVDPDTADGNILFTVLGHKSGHLTTTSNSSRDPGQPITSFTQSDLEESLIFYVTSASEDARLLFKASDGESSSLPVVLRISTYDLQVYLVNNTGLNIVHGTSSTIIPTNLSCSSNIEGQKVRLLYLLTRQPEFGVVQTLNNDEKWEEATEFTEDQIHKHQVRYVHLQGKPKVDSFHFKISALGETLPDEYLFTISFISISVEVVRNAELIMTTIQESFISEGYLYTVTHPKPSPRSEIIYTLLTLPKFGGVYLSTGDLIYQRRLSTNSNFTQDDVTKGRLKYKLNYLTFSDFSDSFLFRVSSNLHESREEVFKISYNSPPFDGVINVQSMILREGSYRVINESNIKISGSGFSRVIFSVIKSPTHGFIYVVDINTRNIVRQNATFFSSTEIESNAVLYQHDDSESFRDSVQFVAITEDSRPNFQVVGSLKIEVIPQNDNPPVRTEKKVIHVVQEASRTITPDDVTYTDLDVATSPMQIQFTNIKVKSGYFYNINSDSVPLERFSQQDINDHVIRFQHQEQPYSTASFTVTDGFLTTEDELEIVASEPYLEIVNNSGIVVARRGQMSITNWNLSLVSNLDSWRHKLTFTVVEEPRHGVVKLHVSNHARQGNRNSMPTFTMEDLKSGRLFYRHDGSNEDTDSFKFTAKLLHVHAGGIFNINVCSTAYWEPLQFYPSALLTVEELSKAPLSPAHLSAHHPAVLPTRVLYTLTQAPTNGVLTVARKDKIMKALQFTQDDVRRGHVEYSQTKRNATRDVFEYVVSNGVMTSSQRFFPIKIVPRRPLVPGGSFSVREGHTRPVPQTILQKLMSQPLDFPEYGRSDIALGPENYSLYGPMIGPKYNRSGSKQSPAQLPTEGLKYETNSVYGSELGRWDIASSNSSNFRRKMDILDTFWAGKNVATSFNTSDDWAVKFFEMFELLKSPKEGRLKIETRPQDIISTVKREELERGLLLYEHSGSESSRDDFIFVRVARMVTVENHNPHHDDATLLESPYSRHFDDAFVSGDENEVLPVARHSSSPVHVTIVIKNENDEAPVVVQNKGVQMWQEDSILITNDVLEVMDADSRSTELVFECSSPNNGHLAFVSAPGHPITSFTQADVNLKRVIFKQSGLLVGGFSWRATDGKYRTAAHVFSVTAKAINTTVTTANNFAIFPLTTRVIKTQHLHAHFNKPDYNQSVFIIIKRQPRAGRVVMKKPNGMWEHAGTFTHREVAGGFVAYEHLRTPTALTEHDDFLFDVESPPLRALKGLVFNITITISNTEQMRELLGSKPVNVAEGESVKISQANLNLSALDKYFSRKIIEDWNPSLLTHLSRLPKHGTLTLSGRALYIGSSIESGDIKRGSLVYKHDHSESHSDSAGIEIHIRNPEDSRPVLICNTSLVMQVTPVNDNEFSLEKAETSIVRFESKVLTEQDLYTSDLDSSPEYIVYQIMSGPDNGKLMINSNSSSGLSFTQSDIASDLVTYSHDGSNSSTTKFFFQVSDGGHSPKYSPFTFHVKPLTLELINHTIIRIMQAATVSRITNLNLAVKSNAVGVDIHFNITGHPKFGKLFINGRMVSTFTQEDVDRGDLMYLQSDMSSNRDAFSVVAWCRDIVLPELDMLIEVQAMLKMRTVQVVSGSHVPITLLNLNATELFLVSDSMPTYRVTEKPRLALLKKETLEKGDDLHSVEVNEFTHADLEANKIFLVVHRLFVEADRPLNDEIIFVLSVSGSDVQPASCILEVIIYPADSNILNMVNNPRQLRPGNMMPDTTTTKINPYGTFDDDTRSLLIVAIILSISLALIVLVSLSVYCTRFRKPAKNDDRKEFDVISLPPPLTNDSRPESFLTDYMSEFATFSDANSPNTFIGERQLECHTSHSDTSLPSEMAGDVAGRDELGAREFSPSLPQCKVTPIFVDPPLMGRSPSNVSQIYQTNIQSEALSDWNTYEQQTKSVNSPMLRKNQYWV
ncbi:hypothetical protein FHG87_016171 [Trinorchestia longiramus]|nr:hypothetical protein FHG87_016171 [Trinorchestia longiramus]